MSLPARGSGRAQTAPLEVTDKFCQKYQANSTANTEEKASRPDIEQSSTPGSVTSGDPLISSRAPVLI